MSKSIYFKTNIVKLSSAELVQRLVKVIGDRYTFHEQASQSFTAFKKSDMLLTLVMLNKLKIERKAMIRNRYNYPTPPIRDIKGDTA